MSLSDFTTNPVAVNLAAFAAGAIAVWFAGTRLSIYADVISARTGLGRAFTGLLLLATVTSLPEIATTATAASLGNDSLLTSNLFGGIAMQTALLSITDFVAIRGALTYFSPRPVLLIQGVLLSLLLGAAIVVIQLGEPFSVSGVGLGAILLFLIYLAFLYASYQYPKTPRWEPKGDLPDRITDEQDRPEALKRASKLRLYGGFLALSLIVGASGWLVARSADALATQTGISSSLVGAVLVAISTSLPELSTTLSAARMGAYGMAVSNIFGSNALMIALVLPGDILFDGVLLRSVEPSVLFLLPLGIVVTCVYLWGLLERRNKTVLRMGVDSLIVLLIYLAGLAGMYSLLQKG